MKRLYIIILTISLFSSFLFCQELPERWKGKVTIENNTRVVFNPAKALSSKAGRIVELKELSRIKDDGEEIVFRSPENLVVDSDDNLYFFSHPHLYKYNKNGKFVFKIIRSGQGPGEAEPGLRKKFAVINKELLVRAISPLKVMKFDLDGNLQEEIKLIDPFRLFDFLGRFENKIYIYQTEVSWELKGKTGYVDFPGNIYSFSSNFKDFEKVFTFPIKHYFNKNAWFGQAFLVHATKDFESVFVTHNSDYKIAKLNLKTRKIESVFARKFIRIKRPKIKKKPGFIYGPDKEFYQDIQKLMVVGENLWVFTSKQNSNGDCLIDVFDMNGIFIDSFFLHFPEFVEPKSYGMLKRIVAKNNTLFSVDQDKDGYYSIGKYCLSK
jgi:hypothetical protein